jgi:hypothetical protein
MKASKFVGTVAAFFCAVGLLHCTNGGGGGSSSGADGGAPFLVLPTATVPASACAPTILPLQPATSWNQNAGTINSACTPQANPEELSFVDVVTGVELTAGSNTQSCCTCTARSKQFKLASTAVAGTNLEGVFAAARGQNDQYAVASMRITVKNGGQSIGSRVFAREDRQNDNCAGSSELPETVLNDLFNIDLSSFATGNTSFDEIDVDLQGYACGNAMSAIALVDLRVTQCGGANTNTPDAGAPPNGPTVGFMPVGCQNPANPMVNVDSGDCPNGVDVAALPATVTCTVESCTGAGCNAQGALTVQGNRVVANCGAVAGQCSSLGFPNPQVEINNRIQCL